MKVRYVPDEDMIRKAMASAPTAASRSAPAGAVPRSGPIPATKQVKK